MIKVFVKNQMDKRKWEEVGTFEASKARFEIVQLTGRAFSPKEWNAFLERLETFKGRKGYPRQEVKVQLV